MENPVIASEAESSLEVKRSTYSRAHRLYYETHRDEIRLKKQAAKPWLNFYQLHKEEERQRAKAKYWRKKQALASSTLPEVPNVLDTNPSVIL